MKDKFERKTPEIKPSINYLAIILIVGLVSILAFIVITVTDEPNKPDFTDFPYSIGALACGITGIFVSKKFKGSEIFGKTYFALGIGFIMLFVGDLFWNYYTLVLSEDPYPSYADIFYLMFYPLAIYHLTSNIRYFRKKIELNQIILLVLIVVGITGWYSYISLENNPEADFDFILGLVYVLLTSITLALTVLGLMVFHDSILGTVWVLLASGIFILTISDTWYYYEEIAGGYTGNHPTNLLWGFAFIIITYALIKHRKVV